MAEPGDEPNPQDEPEDAAGDTPGEPAAPPAPAATSAASRKSGIPQDMGAVGNIPVKVSIVLGNATIQVNEMLKLDRGAILELDHRVGDAIEVFANNQLVARGELVELEDGRLAVNMTEIMRSRLSEL